MTKKREAEPEPKGVRMILVAMWREDTERGVRYAVGRAEVVLDPEQVEWSVRREPEMFAPAQGHAAAYFDGVQPEDFR